MQESIEQRWLAAAVASRAETECPGSSATTLQLGDFDKLSEIVAWCIIAIYRRTTFSVFYDLCWEAQIPNTPPCKF